MKIVYSSHLKRRIKEREFPTDYPKKIYQKAKLHFQDHRTKHHIAVSKFQYAEKLRNLVISYDVTAKSVIIITIHPISDDELKRKIQSGRWKRL